jgi:hypothetical protein
MPSKRSETEAIVALAWGQWIAEMGEWHVFGGLTYDQRRRGTVPGADVARAHVQRWLRHAGKNGGPHIEAAVVALEYQKNGWPHFHPLLRVRGGLQRGDIPALGQAWFKPHGYARLEPPRSRSDVCIYAAKYLSKDLSKGDVIFWPPRGDLRTHQEALQIR